jgi:C-terminal processing protease CtpA/Prc
MTSGRGQRVATSTTRWAATAALTAILTGAAACVPEPGTIGAVIGQTADRQLVLREVPPSLAAGRAGLKPGDQLLLIDGRDVRELDQRGVHQALSGDVDEPVKLTLLREGQVIRVTLKRTPIPRKG